MQPKNALIARICHDLITPFNAISLGIEAYEASGDASLLENIKESSRKANVILKFMRELYSEKSDTFRHSFVSLSGLISDFLSDRGIVIDIKFNADAIPHSIAQILMHNALMIKEFMPFGGTLTSHVDKNFNEITLSYSGKATSAPDLNLSDELSYKNIALNELIELLKEIGWELNVLSEAQDVLISEKNTRHI
jgi:hypothetical protein